MIDTKVKPQTEIEALFQLNKPTLHALSYALRHPDTWPKDFVWNYRECNQCAMGLAHQLWAESIPNVDIDNAASVFARKFAMPYGVAKSIFLGDVKWCPLKTKIKGALWWRKEKEVTDLKAVTPEMVADQIDAYLAKIK